METLTKQTWTDSALLALPKERGKFELIDGEITRMSPAGYSHSDITLNVAEALRQFVRPQKLGRVLESSAGFRLDPDNVLSPDVAFVSREKERRSPPPVEGFFLGAPDLVVEVISPSERKTEVRLKAEKYFVQGTRLVWLVYPRRKQVEVYAAPDAMTTVASGELDGGDVLPGFRLPLDTIFEDWF